ncbi:MAG: sugar phosphate isomerase/epimerase [Clostridia bacterium]|nr:sugar phosphate isomerase/epimerase [Clostridia bacterium]
MKKGISVWSFAETEIEKIFALASDAGFDGVELALAEDGPVNLNSTKEDMEEIKKLADHYGLELYSLASGLYWQTNYTASNPEVRNKAIAITKKQLELASYLGMQSILVVPGAVGVEFEPGSEVVPYDVAYDRCKAALLELAPVAEEYGVEIGIENVWNKFLLSPLEMRDLIDSINSPFVGSYFDVGNVVYCGYPEHWISILGKRIKKVHFKDYRKDPGGLNCFVDILAGDVDYKAVKAGLDAIGYTGWVTAEMLPPYTQYPETIVYNTSNAMDKILGRK